MITINNNSCVPTVLHRTLPPSSRMRHHRSSVRSIAGYYYLTCLSTSPKSPLVYYRIDLTPRIVVQMRYLSLSLLILTYKCRWNCQQVRSATFVELSREAKVVCVSDQWSSFITNLLRC